LPKLGLSCLPYPIDYNGVELPTDGTAVPGALQEERDMEIVSPHIWYPSGYPGTAYDLREAIAWNPKSGFPDIVVVRFVGGTVTVVEFNLAAFEVAKQTSLDNGG